MLARLSRPLGAGLLALVCLNSCSGSSSGGGGGGSGASGINNPVQAYVVDNAVLAFSGIARMRLLVPIVLFPSMHASAGITFELDTTPGVAPHTYDYVIPLDADGDGTVETTIEGRAVLSDDLTLGGIFVSGFTASIDVMMTTNGGQGVFTGTIEAYFDMGGGFRVSGTGTYDDAQTNSTVTITVDPANALHIRTADERPDRMPNACIWTVDGEAQVDASNDDGDYMASWDFDITSKLIDVTNASFTPPGGPTEMLSDSNFEAAPCPMTGTINDWAGTYSFDWFCPPAETGESTLTITVLNSTTIEITDEEVPAGGGVLVYRATRDANDPHVVHGEFVDTDGGGTYEEGFTWILSQDGSTFYQVSEYFYVSGPLAGSGGDCGGIATRN